MENAGLSETVHVGSPEKGNPNPVMGVLVKGKGMKKGRFSTGQLLDRLPEILEINDKKLRFQVLDIFEDLCPAYFWTAPASFNHHQPEHREYRGLWLHTKRAFSAYEGLIDSPVEQGHVTEYEADCGRAAILLHDLWKQGRTEVGSGTTHGDHDKELAKYLRKNTDLPLKAVKCVDTHNGPWYDGMSPITELEKVHHYADMIASRETMKGIEVLEPHPELLYKFEDLNHTEEL